MLIDWFTVGAQVLNFIILVWLMKRFLYQPILHAIDAREERIAGQLAEASATEVSAKEALDKFKRKNAAFDEDRSTRLAKLKVEVNAERERLFEEVERAADAVKTKREKAFQDEASHFNTALRGKAQVEIFAVVRQTLRDLTDTGLESRAADLFLERLADIEPSVKKVISEALHAAKEPALVRSAFALSPEIQARIQYSVEKNLSCDRPLRFETSLALVGGIEVITPGQKVAWSMASYLDALEKSVFEGITEKTHSTVAQS